MTTPGGVPNLPKGALTLDNISSVIEDMSAGAMKSRAVDRIGSVFNNSTGLSPALDITPLGILTAIWGQVNSLIANADPADIQGPEDIPDLVLQFIEGLPLVGQFVEILEAILGNYDGDDDTLSQFQNIFAPIRKLLQLLTGVTDDFPDLDDLTSGDASGFITNLLTPTGLILGKDSPLNALNIFGLLRNSVPIGTLTDQHPNLTPLGSFPDGSIASNPFWSVDMSKTRTADGSGSAKVTADGTAKALRSGKDPSEKITISVGQTFGASIYVGYQNYVGTGETVLLQIVPFIGNVQAPPVSIATYSPPTGSLPLPGYLLSGKYEVPEGVTAVQTRILVTDGAISGDFYFDDCDSGQDGKFQMGWIEGLPESLQESVARWQLLVDTWTNVIRGTDTIGNGLADLEDAIRHLPGDFIGGSLGSGTLPDTFQAILDKIAGGIVDAPDGTGATPADLFSLLKQLSGKGTLGEMAFNLLGVRNGTSVSSGLLATGQSNIPLSQVRSKATPGYATVTTTSAVASDRVEASRPLGVIGWIGYGVTGITDFRVTAWKVLADKSKALAHVSANLIGLLDPTATSANPKHHRYVIPTPPATVEGEEYVYEWTAVGGTHYILADVQGTWAPNDPNATLDSYGYTRSNPTPGSPPATLAASAFTSTNVVPWVEVAIDLGDTTGYHEPAKIYRTESGSVPVPLFAKYVDLVPLGPSSKGAAGTTLGFEGNHGQPGVFSPRRLVRGVDFTNADTSVTYTITPTATTVTLGSVTITVAKPADGSGQHFGHTDAPGVNPIEFQGERYDGAGPQSTAGQAGVAPGGAGAGGKGLFFGAGGAGAVGCVWMNFIQGETTGAPIPGTANLTGIASAQAFGGHTLTNAGVPVIGQLPLATRNAIDAIFAAEMALNKQPGTGIALTSPQGDYVKSYGKVSASGRTLNLEDHLYMGSITKTFTVWCLFREIDKGNVTLDDPLENHIPGIPNGFPTVRTIRHLLSMQSGLYDYQADTGSLILYGFLSPNAAFSSATGLSLIKGHAAMFEAGTAYQYTNSNYLIAGLIVEKYNPGRTIKNVIEQDLIAPLGLGQTTWPPNGAPPVPAAGATGNNTDWFGAAGALATTIGDMLKWGKELRDGTLISSAVHNEWMAFEAPQPYTGEGPATFGYGYGKVSLGSWMGHDGAILGWGSNLMFEPHTGSVIATFENAASPGLGALARLFYRTADLLYPTSALIENYGQAQTVNAVGGIPTAAAFGELRNVPLGTVGLNGIPTAETFGALTVVPPVTPVQFDNFVYGATGYAATCAITITVAAGGCEITAFGAASAGVTGATCGGAPMTLVDVAGNLACYKIVLPPTDSGGAKTIVMAGGTGGWNVCAWSHKGVTSSALAAKQDGTGATPSFGPVSVAPGTGQKLLQVWAAFNYSASAANITATSGGLIRLAAMTDGSRVGMAASEALMTTTFQAATSPAYYNGYSAMAVRLS